MSEITLLFSVASTKDTAAAAAAAAADSTTAASSAVLHGKGKERLAITSHHSPWQ